MFLIRLMCDADRRELALSRLILSKITVADMLAFMNGGKRIN